MIHRRLALAMLAALALGSATQAAADSLLRLTAGGRTVELGLADLRAMPVRAISTATIWTEGVQTFTGVPLAALLAALDIPPTALRLRAINDYSVEVPVEDILADAPIVAYLRQGRPMALRDKGPLWLIYPYDSGPEWRSEGIYTRSIWQLDRIEVLQ
jgi:hypothetical protein